LDIQQDPRDEKNYSNQCRSSDGHVYKTRGKIREGDQNILLQQNEVIQPGEQLFISLKDLFKNKNRKIF
jgi:hypothetical protein